MSINTNLYISSKVLEIKHTDEKFFELSVTLRYESLGHVNGIPISYVSGKKKREGDFCSFVLNSLEYTSKVKEIF